MAGHDEAAVVVAVGREIGGRPVGLDRWREIRTQAEHAVGDYGTVYTRDALGHGEWDGRSEESVTVSGGVEPAALGRVLVRAAGLAESHEQDAIAVTVGVTVLVGLDSGADLADRLRGLADALDGLA